MYNRRTHVYFSASSLLTKNNDDTSYIITIGW